MWGGCRAGYSLTVVGLGVALRHTNPNTIFFILTKCSLVVVGFSTICQLMVSSSQFNGAESDRTGTNHGSNVSVKVICTTQKVKVNMAGID